MEQIILTLFVALVLYAANRRSNGELLAEVPNDIRMLLSKPGRRLLRIGRRFMHFHYTGLPCFSITSLAFLLDRFADAIWYDKVLLAVAVALGGLTVNLVREGKYHNDGNADFDMTDVRFGFYGGLVYSLAAVVIVTLVLKAIL